MTRLIERPGLLTPRPGLILPGRAPGVIIPGRRRPLKRHAHFLYSGILGNRGGAGMAQGGGGGGEIGGDSLSNYWAPPDNQFVPAAADLSGGTEDGAVVTADPTIHSCGLYWAPATGSGAVTCQVIYKPDNEDTWREGLELYWDDFPRLSNQPPAQYKGSLFFLKPNTAYTARLKLSNGQFKEVQFTTRPNVEDLPVGDTTEIGDTATQLTITAADSGTANGYHRYAPAVGGGTIDVNDNQRYCIEIEAGVHHVIIDSLILRDAQINGIYFSPTSGDETHDIVITGCDISGWGIEDPNVPGFGETRYAGIGNEDDGLNELHENISRVTVDRCTIHDPRWDASAWDEPNGTGNQTHPEGPTAIWLWRSNGGHVFRYNHIFGSTDGSIRFNDAISGGAGAHKNGFNDTDIYHNIIRFWWDDGIAVDEMSENCRIWGNYFDDGFQAISTQAVHLGPVYIFRNLSDTSRKFATEAQGTNNGGAFNKHQAHDGGEDFGFGRIYSVSNTLYQRANELGNRQGDHNQGVNARTARDHITRNNILDASSRAFRHGGDPDNDFENDFDYDLYRETTIGTDTYTGAEPNGIDGRPTYLSEETYDPDAGSHDWRLDPASNGYEDGIFVKGLTLNLTSATPDMGAHEKDTDAIPVGPTAFQS